MALCLLGLIVRSGLGTLQCGELGGIIQDDRDGVIASTAVLNLHCWMSARVELLRADSLTDTRDTHSDAAQKGDSNQGFFPSERQFAEAPGSPTQRDHDHLDGDHDRCEVQQLIAPVLGQKLWGDLGHRGG